jgi:tyrosine decarboxylase/aspartate 1-decarboxylase
LTLFDEAAWPDAGSAATVTCLRSVLMKPEHLEWIERIWRIFDSAAGSVLSC